MPDILFMLLLVSCLEIKKVQNSSSRETKQTEQNTPKPQNPITETQTVLMPLVN